MSPQPLSVFVSSTCYDLKQVRSDLRDFLVHAGFDPILSEYDQFPVDPHADAVRNCLENVKTRCDIFVLIIGGRYGSTAEEGKSITNLEYLEARAKGVPIYVFAMKEIVSLLPVWKLNPRANFSNVVDSPKLFEFLEQLRQPSEHWVFEFEKAQDIVATLRSQMSYLFSESLELRRMIRGSGLGDALSGLTGNALALAVHCPVLWDVKLFCCLMSEKLKEADQLRCTGSA